MNLLFTAGSIFIDRPVLFLELQGDQIGGIKLKNTPGFPLSALPVGLRFPSSGTATNSYGTRSFFWRFSNFGPGLSTLNIQNFNASLPWNIPPDVRFYVNNTLAANTFYTNTSPLYVSAFPLTGWVSTNPAYDPPPEFETSFFLSDYLTLNNSVSAAASLLLNSSLFNQQSLRSYTITTTGLNVFNTVKSVNLTNNTINFINLTQFRSLTSISTSNSLNFLSSLNLLANTELSTFSFNSTPNLIDLDLSNNKKLEVFQLLASKINLNSVLSATSALLILDFRLNTIDPSLNTNLNFSSEPRLNICNLFDLTGYNSFNFTDMPFLNTLTLQRIKRTDSTNAIYNFNNLPSLRSVNITNMPELSSSNIDTLFNILCSSTNLGAPSGSSFNYTYLDYPTMSGRSANSTPSFYSLLKRGYANISPVQIDPVQPIQLAPPGYIPSTVESMTVINPVSATTINGILSTTRQIPHLTLSGTYFKTSDRFNNRDVFKNSNEYYMLYNSSLNSWTIVGPSSSSNFIWLSSFHGFQGQSYGDWGNPPCWRWSGPAFALGRFGGGVPNFWYQPTNVFNTNMLLFSSLRFDSNVFTSNTMDTTSKVGSGFNSPDKFLFSDFDFTGITYFGNSTDPWNFSGRGTMISPIHIIFAYHYPPGWANYSLPNNSSTTVFDKNFNRTVLTVVTGRTVVNDIAVGIISPSTPYTGTFYPLLSSTTTTFSGNFENFYIGPGCFSRILWGPLKNGKVGYAQPILDFRSSSSSRNSFSPTVTSIKNSQWNVHDTPTVGDSSTQNWITSGNKLILVGNVQFSNNTGPSYITYYDSIVRACTALNVAVYGPDNAFLHIPKGLVFDKNLIEETTSQLSPRLGTWFDGNEPRALGMRIFPRITPRKRNIMAKISKRFSGAMAPVRTHKGFDLPFYSSYPGDINRPFPYSELSVATIKDLTILDNANRLQLVPRYGLTKFNYQIRNKTLHSLSAVRYGYYVTNTNNISANYVDCIQKLVPFIEEKLARKTGVPENYDAEAIVNCSRWCETPRRIYRIPNDPLLEIPAKLINPSGSNYTALSTTAANFNSYIDELTFNQAHISGFRLKIIHNEDSYSIRTAYKPKIQNQKLS